VSASLTSSRRTYRGLPVDITIDVRSRLEFWLGHLPGAVNMPLGGLTGRLAERAELSKNSRIVVYCASGMRSASAAQQVRTLGYTRVTDAGAMAVAEAEYR
jgi:phage shock protein E